MRLQSAEIGSENVNEEIVRQMQTLNQQELERQKKAIEEDVVVLKNLSAFEEYEKSGSLQRKSIGLKLLAEGKVGCLLIAGGQGSRLNYTKPKGLYPVSLVQKKSLFQLFAERVKAAGDLVGRPLFVAIMTSPGNEEETISYFKENNFFGLEKEQLFFYSQEELPFLDAKGNLFLEAPNRLAMGPNGNASSLKHFFTSGLWDSWQKAGICYLNYFHVDNALADPFDAELTGFHAENAASDVIIKCIERTNPLEKIGVLFKRGETVSVVEYSEISQEERDARKEDGSLKNACANIGLYSFRMDFVREVGLRYYDELPFHKAWKAAKCLTDKGTFEMSKTPIAWKFEKFIFDVLPFAKEVKAILYPRKECFAPLKNAEGEDSLQAVQIALWQRDKAVFEQISGISVKDRVFELHPAFYYPTKELLKKWKDKQLPESSYILP
jgi:UDP-N-acetylglucosamine/UDP-N-acetylgalactosamine diphosphorylase